MDVINSLFQSKSKKKIPKKTTEIPNEYSDLSNMR